MTIQIAVVYLILILSLVLFISERISYDLVALLVLGALALTGLVSPAEAFSGFSNPAVITVWSMFIISQGLANAGIADRMGRQIVRLAGRGEAALLGFVALTAAVLSAFMNNIGVAALLLPVTIDVSSKTGISPSRLLMPMAFGSLLGGLTTLVGTPPNLLVSMSLQQAGYPAFALFDFAKLGVPIVVVSIAFFLVAGRYLLPAKSPAAETRYRGLEDLRARYKLQERTFILRVTPGSRLDGKSIADSQLATVAGVKVVALMQHGHARLLPSQSEILRGGEQLLVQGRADRLSRLRDWGDLIVSREAVIVRDLISSEVLLFEVRLAEGSALAGTAIRSSEFRERFRGNLLAVRRDNEIRRTRFSEFELHSGDRLLVQGGHETLDLLEASVDFDECFQVSDEVLVNVYQLPRQIFVIRVPSDSSLVGQTLAESGIGKLFSFHLLGVIRAGQLNLMPEHDEAILAEDRLLIQGTADQVDVLRAFQELEIDSGAVPNLGELESEKMEMIEVTLAPRSSRAGDTIAQFQFREKYGVEVLAVWRGGKAYRSDLATMPLKFGDAFLLFGPREKLKMLEREPDFLVMTPVSQKVVKHEKSLLAALILAAVVASVLSGWLPIAVAAVAGAALMVLSGCLSMEEAYGSVEWKSIFLIAGMLPLGIALQSSGGATFMANAVMDLMRDAGPWAVILSFYGVTALATLFVPTAALVVLMSPIVMTASADMGISPQTGMMAVAIAASASFASPVSHPANLLVMGPGGYRFVDYLKLGLPLTLLVGVLTAILLPFVWPLVAVS
jgi:di/tricarboxylate transporter